MTYSSAQGYVLDACWDSLGTPNGNGYRTMTVDGRKQYVHRISYLLFHGSIPPRMVIDHLCRNRGCWNPRHLDLTTNAENILRGESPPAQNARKTHCSICGSEYRPDGKYRRCGPCKQRIRKDTKRLGVGRPGERTHCPQDHAYSEENTILVKRPDGSVKQRACRECSRERVRARRRAAKGR